MINLLHKPTLQGEKVILRPFTVDDVDSMIECIEDPEVTKLTGSQGTFTREVLNKWYGSRNEQADRLDLAIVDKSNGIVVGEVVMNEYDPEKHSMNFRILIGPKGRDKGLGTESTKLMIDYVFSTTDLKQITLGVYAFNPRAQRVYEKVGFVFESIVKDELEYEGEKVDMINMVLSRDRWEQMKTQL